MRAGIKLIIVSLTGILSVVAYAQGDGIGLVADSLLGPLSMLREVMNAASILTGIYLLASAFMRYLRHRKNPQESPLGTVIFWAVLGVVLIAIPLTYHYSTMFAKSTGVGDVV